MPFADELLGDHAVEALLAAVAAAAPGRPLPALRSAAGQLADRSLRERSDLLRDALLTDLPGGYPELAATVRAAAAGPLPFQGWLIWPVTGAVAARAVADGGGTAFADAMALLAALTGRLTSEFSLRVLLGHDLDRALEIVADWPGSPDEHVRRLASEGTRLFLPWARRVPALLAHPERTLPIVTALYRDDSEYVRRSVANHLNDLSRVRPDLVVATAAAWLAAPDRHTPRLVRHGLRTLIKQGHPGALALLGFAPATVEIIGPVPARAEVPYGGELAFTATVVNTGDAAATLAIDYVVHHRKANGTRTGKTFKLTTVTLAPGQRFAVERRHSFQEITTRRYHPGAHAVELQVNGVRSGPAEFVLGPPGQ
ncbi:DNA alkylation repair protein [Actinoplanes sp. NPDC049599]|uniref:DNA alkylation repair protein n=1 Tax=Actinoplanes sp. NPDC049599 TaxID=3363903 RepID=UPI00378FB5BD